MDGAAADAARPAGARGATAASASGAAPSADFEAAFDLALPGGGTLAVRMPQPHAVCDSLRWLLDSHDRALGLDVEGHVSLVQLSTPTRALLLRWRGLADAADSPGFAALCALLSDASVIKTGCELRHDAISLLADSAQRARLRGGRDLSPALRRPGAAGERRMVLGLGDAYNLHYPNAPAVKDKAVSVTAWDAEELTQQQLEYAALDAWMSHRLGCVPALVADPAVAKVDITAVSDELADACRQLELWQAIRSRGRAFRTSPQNAALPDTAAGAGWHRTAEGELLLVARARQGCLQYLDCADVRLPGRKQSWAAVVLARRWRTAVLCAHPARAQELPNTPPAVLGVDATGRSLLDEVERLKQLAQPVTD